MIMNLALWWSINSWLLNYRIRRRISVLNSHQWSSLKASLMMIYSNLNFQSQNPAIESRITTQMLSNCQITCSIITFPKINSQTIPKHPSPLQPSTFHPILSKSSGEGNFSRILRIVRGKICIIFNLSLAGSASASSTCMLKVIWVQT